MLQVIPTAFIKEPGNAMDIDDVLKAFGCQQKDLAEYFGLTESAITRWRNRSIPLDKAFELEHLSNGKVAVGLDAIRARYDANYKG